MFRGFIFFVLSIKACVKPFTLKELEEVDRRTLSEEELKKPEKPQILNEEDLYKQVETEFYKCFKEPGHPILLFDVVNESSITPTEQLTNS
jgi:hypothetical protein